MKVLAICDLPFETSAFNSLFYGGFILNQDSPHQPAASARPSQSGVLGFGGEAVASQRLLNESGMRYISFRSGRNLFRRSLQVQHTPVIPQSVTLAMFYYLTNSYMRTTIAAMLLTTLLHGNVSANTVTNVAVQPVAPEVNKALSVKFTFQENPSSVACGLTIDWGDGKIERLRVGEGHQVLPPFLVEHTYVSPGSYKIRINGEGIARGLRSVFPCAVRLESSISVVDPIELERQRAEAQRIAQERAEAQITAEREKRERQEAEEARRANLRAEAEAARNQKLEQIAKLISDPKVSLGAKLSGSCYTNADEKNWAWSTGNSPFLDTCNTAVLERRVRQGGISVINYMTDTDIEIAFLSPPTPSNPNAKSEFRLIKYSTKGDLLTQNFEGCMQTSKVQVKVDSVTFERVKIEGRCDDGMRASFNRLQKMGPSTYKLMRRI